MGLATEFWMARRYLAGSRGQEGRAALSAIALFSFLGVVLGVATLIVVMAVMDGFRIELLSRILAVNGQIALRATPGDNPSNYEDIASALERIDRVRSVIPFYDGQALISAGDEAAGALVRGVRLSDLKRKPVIAENILRGALPDSDGRAIILGDRLARRLKLEIGDLATLIVTNPADPSDPSPRIESYPLAATFEVGLYDFDSAVAYLPLAELQAFYRVGDVVTSFEISADIDADSDRLIDQVWQVTEGRFGLQDWRQAGASFFELIKTQQNIMFLVLSLIIIVAALNIVSSQIMLVNGKVRDIAILRTLGAGAGMILRLFFFVGASIGLLGTLVGTGIGLLFATHIDRLRQLIERTFGVTLFDPELRSLTKLPAEVQPGTLAFVVGFAVLLSLAASLYPAWKAARRTPVDGLRYG